MKNLVSIIIPCYNGAAFIAETIKSVLDQSYENVEIIVIDDGSTDDSARVINGFQDKKITYIYQNNQGLSAARNTGLKASKGKYITFLDADDLFLPQKIENQVLFLEKNETYGLVAQGFIRTDQRGKHLYTSTESAKDIDLKELIQQSQFPVHTTLIRREWIDEIGCFDTNLKAAEDWDFYCRLGIAGCKMYKQAVAECTYRLLDNAMTTNAPRQTEMLLKVVDKTFAHPKLLPELQHLKKEAIFQIALMGASRCFALNYFEKGIIYLKQAIEIDRKKVTQLRYERLIHQIAFFTKHMQVPDTEQKASKIIAHCGEELPFLNKLEQKLDFNIGLLSSSNKLAYLFNRGLTNPFVVIKSLKELIIFKLLFKE